MPEFYDLSHGFDEETYHPFGFPAFANKEHFASHRCRHAVATLSLHTGTHIDAPWHMIEDGRRLDQIPISELVGPAVVLDLSAGYGPGLRSAPREIALADLRAALSAAGLELARGDALLVRTGWEGLFKTDPSRYYREYRIPSAETCEWLARSGARIFGLDSPDVDAPERYRAPPFDPANHRILLGGGVLVIENVGGEAAALAGRRVLLIPAPLKVGGEYASGAPVRLLAARLGDIG